MALFYLQVLLDHGRDFTHLTSTPLARIAPHHRHSQGEMGKIIEDRGRESHQQLITSKKSTSRGRGFT
jgi:hypothetical protein